jgi:group I intron endonuclease
MDRVTRELSRKSGIYCIVNTINQKKYIGSSKNLHNRLMSHRAYLRTNNHFNKKLQNSWNKYGENNFQYFIMEFCEENVLLEREQYYINKVKPWFNIIVEVQELKMSEETKIKMSNSRIEGIKNGTIKLYQEKPIFQYSLEGQFIRGFQNIKEASEITGVNRSNINRFLAGIYKKGGNFLWSLTKEESLSPYCKPIKNNSYLNKAIEVTDLTTMQCTTYESLRMFSAFLNKNYSAIHHAFKLGYPYMKRYMIKYKTAV